ncbi:MAG: formylglycine-generating enzyme family protein [Candidatus Poseidoniales archaeon]|nr:MAG: formylglycine-generating enzyme family protein [Candidatus Poseidoniales archaeon]
MPSTRPSFDDAFGGRYLLVEPGTYQMGDGASRGNKNERPAHKVDIDQPFFFGERPVTQAHWQAIMETNPSKFQEGWAAGLRPVENVSWNDVHVFLARLNSTEQETVRLGFTGSWRLPSESEWEYVARAGTETRWAFGDRDSELNDYGWHAGNAGATTREVGQKKANPWGFLDMYGQTGEWCQDDYSKNYENHDGSQSPQISTGGERKVHRGGSWFTESDSTRSRARASATRTTRSDGIGFRLVWAPQKANVEPEVPHSNDDPVSQP